MEGDKELQDLHKLLQQVQKDLKRKMFPRKHKKVLYRDVVIEVGDLKPTTAGTYECVKDKDNKYKFHHKITISKKTYFDFKLGLWGSGRYKRYARKAIKDVIAHELLHAYVYENYEYYNYGFHHDGSPIFLSMLCFLGINSGHKVMISFKRTDTYKRIKEFKTFESLENFLMLEMFKYEKKFEELKQLEIEKGKKYYMNCFYFSYGKATGIIGTDTFTVGVNGILIKSNTFEVGPVINLETLKDLAISKADRNVFTSKSYDVLDKDIALIKEQYKLQSMNI